MRARGRHVAGAFRCLSTGVWAVSRCKPIRNTRGEMAWDAGRARGESGDERLRVHRQTDRENGEGFSRIELESLCACVLRPVQPLVSFSGPNPARPGHPRRRGAARFLDCAILYQGCVAPRRVERAVLSAKEAELPHLLQLCSQSPESVACCSAGPHNRDVVQCSAMLSAGTCAKVWLWAPQALRKQRCLASWQ